MARQKLKDRGASFDRLPLWAQEEMARLEQRAIDAERRAEEVESQFPGTNVRRHVGMTYADLPPDSRIRFFLGKEHCEWVDVHVGEEAGEPMLEVCGGDLFQVLPRAANSIRIRVKR